MKTPASTVALISLISALYPHLTHADALSETNADSLNQAQQCATVEDNGTRLECYDNLFKTSSADVLTSAMAGATDTATESQAEKNKVNELDEFGAQHLPDRPTKEEGLTRIESVIIKVQTNNRKIRSFTLENGQVWREKSAGRWPLKNGTSVYIEKGLFSAHFMSTEGSNRRLNVRRVK